LFAQIQARAFWRGPFCFGGKNVNHKGHEGTPRKAQFEEKTTTGFRGLRVTHAYTQTNFAAPEIVFSLLCPVREAEWVPGWRYRLIYSQSGVAELGCVFVTEEKGREITWVVTEYDAAAFRIGFVWVDAGVVTAQIGIRLEASGDSTTAHIQYTYTGLSSEGNGEVERFDESWFRHKMQSWEAAINHYLTTGEARGEARGAATRE
jgi:hypothetical protein